MSTEHIYTALILTSSGYHAIIPELSEPVFLGNLFVEAKSECGEKISDALRSRKISARKNPIIMVKAAAERYLRDNGIPKDHFIDIIEAIINC